MNNNNINAILNFIAGCNEFINGKFLFATAKLQSLYDEILISPDLDKLFGECSQDFNYSLEMTKAFVKMPTKIGYFTKPEELDKFLALIFGVLKEIKENTLDFNVFVNKYFPLDDKTPPTQKFAKSVIVPLRDTVAKYFELDQNNKTRFVLEDFVEEAKEEQQPKTEEEPQVKEDEINLAPIFDAINEISQEMLTIVKQDKRLKNELQNDASFVLGEITHACLENDIEKAYALIVGFKYLSNNIKSIKLQMRRLSDVLEQLESI